MAFISIDGVSITGIAAAVPKQKSINTNTKFIATTGVEEVRISENNTCTSDLCLVAAEQLIKDLSINKDDIQILLFVSQTSDYKLPVTSTILQHKLNLPQSCICFDIPLGCSGYVYGLMTIASLLSAGKLTKGLLLVGDTISKEISPTDQSAKPLFGDAGTATLLSYDELARPLLFGMGSDGEGYRSIIIPDGGSRNKFNTNSLVSTVSEGISRTGCDLVLEGMDVFTFGVNKIPKIVYEFLNYYTLDLEAVDYAIFHQANKFMNDKIYKKLGLSESKVPTSLRYFGNTSSASIPLTVVTQLGTIKSNTNILFCGFGVGLSWGSLYISITKDIHCSTLIEI